MDTFTRGWVELQKTVKKVATTDYSNSVKEDIRILDCVGIVSYVKRSTTLHKVSS